jgi:hypothetical protein
VWIDRTVLNAEVSLAAMRERNTVGTAIADNRPIKAVTKITSINVNPAADDFRDIRKLAEQL